MSQQDETTEKIRQACLSLESALDSFEKQEGQQKQRQDREKIKQLKQTLSTIKQQIESLS